MTIDAEHGDEVGRVDAISQEFDSHTWGEVGRLGVLGLGDGHADVAGISTLEHTSVGVGTLADPLNLGSHSLGVNGFVAATVPCAGELVADSVKDGA